MPTGGLCLILFAIAGFAACSARTDSTGSTPPPQVVTVSIPPGPYSVAAGAQQQFSATVTGTANTMVRWAATGGTISSTGDYTAGNNAGTFSVTATSAADTSKSAQMTVTITAAVPPPPPAGTASSINKDGITWTFSQAVPVGQFVNGDYYVVGPVTIIAIDPAPTTATPYENGSVKNLPTANSKSGFDSRLNDGTDESFWFDPTVRVYAPISLKPGLAGIFDQRGSDSFAAGSDARLGYEHKSGGNSFGAYGAFCRAQRRCVQAFVLRPQRHDLSREFAPEKFVAFADAAESVRNAAAFAV